MAIAAPVNESLASLLLDRRHRITVEEYRRMSEAGVFDPEARLELLEGVLVEKMTKHPPHILATDLIGALLHRNVPEGYFASMGNPITLEVLDSQPEPDAQVVRGHPRDYEGRQRGSGDVALAIEVSDSSYATDRRVKWRLYAASGIPIYWLLDLRRCVLEVHSDPSPDGYRALRTLGADDDVSLILDGREVVRFPVHDILP